MEQSRISIVVACVTFVLIVGRILRLSRRPPNFPPGPPTLPIIGNMHVLPRKDVHVQFNKWAKEYGPIFSLIVGTQTFVVLSSDVVVKELLDKRGAIYSDRMDAYLAKLCSEDHHMLTMGYGPQWRMARRLLNSLLNVNVAKSYVRYQLLENKQLMYELLEEPNNFLASLQRYANSLATSMVYGRRTPQLEDPLMKEILHGLEEFGEIASSFQAALLDCYPVLRRLPDSRLEDSIAGYRAIT